MAEALAVLAAVGFAGSAVAARLALRESTIVTGILVGNVVGGVILLGAVWVDPPPSVPLHATVWFVVAGVIGGQGLAAVAILLGLERLGPPTHVPLQGGAYGIAVSIGAALFLSETVGPRKALGVAAVVIGAGWLVRAQADLTGQPVGGWDFVRTSLASLPRWWFLPLAAGGALATSDLIAKSNLRGFPHPMYAAAVALGGGLLFWGVVVAVVPALRRSLRLGRSARWFVAAGAFLGVAFASLNAALNRGDASTVGPIVASEPLAAILLSALFLSALHKVSLSMVLAGSLVVAGAILVSI